MSKESNFRDQLKAGGNFKPDMREALLASNLRLLDKNSEFAGQFTPNEWRAFVEFDLCHALPVVSQPAFGTGNMTCFHPQTLANCYGDLLYQQTNLEHLLKAHQPDVVSHDRIIGCVVATSFPPEPEGGWKIGTDKLSAPCIHCCAVVFKIADGALDMLKEQAKKEREWSVSIEVMGRSIEEMGVFRPSTGELYSLPEVPDLWFEALKKDKAGRLCVGKLLMGEQLALAYGGAGGRVMFQGVGFTGTPASLEARITGVQLKAEGPSRTGIKKEELDQILKTPQGVMAVQMSGVNTAVAQLAVTKRFPGSTITKIIDTGKAQLAGHYWKIDATSDDPVIEIKLARGPSILKRMSELAAA